MAGHGWLTRAENALTSDTVNADNYYYVKQLRARTPPEHPRNSPYQGSSRR